MKKNRVLDDIDIKNIISSYNEKNSLQKIAKEFKVGLLRIKEVLKDNNVLSNKTNITQESSEKYKNRLSGEYYEITCKSTNKKFFGSGVGTSQLTAHLKSIYPEIVIPNNFEKRKYFLKYNTLWHEQYFTYTEINKPEVIKCKLCKWESKDITNISGAYTNHIKDFHGKSVENYLIDFPDEIKYFNTFRIKMEKQEYLTKEDNSITCLECGKILKAVNQGHLKIHNMTVKDYKLKHNIEIITSKTTHKTFKKNLHSNNINVKPTFESKPEKEIKNFINSFTKYEFKKNRKLLKGKEVDLVCEELKICIEFNGNKWHSENFGKKGMYYHLNKTQNLKDLGYNLIHIFEDEWNLKQELVKYKLKHILGNSDGIKIGGRKCKIEVIKNADAKLFLDKYHIQGSATGNIHLGAFYKNQLVAVMSFNKKRNMTNSKIHYEYDLIRFATDYNYIIQGIGSKLFSYFIKNYNPTSIISFADRRWSFENNNVYQITGFKKDGYTKPNYFYYKNSVDRLKRFHKFGFGLNSLKKKGLYIQGMSEWQCMQHHGWDRIWDCGLIRYVWHK